MGAFTIEKNVVYGNAANAYHRLDVYKPVLGANRPAVVMFHGGGWDAGDKFGLDALASGLATRGIVVFNANYQLNPARPWLAQPSDVVRAFNWAVKNAATYGADPARVGIFGTSAGATIALLHAYNPGIYSKPKAAAGFSTPSDLAAILTAQGFDTSPAPYEATVGESGYPSNKIQELMGWCHLAGCYPSPEPDQPMIEDCGGACAERYAAASPITHAGAGDPPTFLAHYTNDQVVPFLQSEALCDKLEGAGVYVELYSPAGATAPYHDMNNDALTITRTGDFFTTRL